ncbi:hypothetical protein JKI95_05095 [Corynebacterium aquatimens]|uniref:hypothetical protein n=1 Tax=Corynebacterium aquatimens TaxID=1190508 RepID=UPI002540AE5C|nr:hypothetical protein [Corynebacterium aquatimens]QYH20288.1 hypothetical protein JKI95_05095 [Corynebacterium aquatimens]
MSSPAGTQPTPLRLLASESLSIPGRAATLLVRHFPQLVTVICLGLAGRQAVIWLAVWLSISPASQRAWSCRSRR